MTELEVYRLQKSRHAKRFVPQIEGLSIGGVATKIDDPAEQEKTGRLMFEKFPQIAQYVPEDAGIDEMAFFKVDPQVISLLDYKQGFGHTELVRV